MRKKSLDAGLFDLGALDDFLLSDQSPKGSMMLSDLDGFLTAIAIGPELIKPSEWLPRIWGDEEPEFLSERQATMVLSAILGRYNEILTQVRDDPGSFQPLFWENKNGQMIVDDWVAGFMEAVAMRPERWRALIDSEQRKYFAPIAVHVTDAEGNRPIKPEESENVKAIMDQAAELIPEGVIGIDRFFKHTRQFFEGGAKPGRNDPCFCGSGKKFKKCCGRH